jgi:polar amino acid transport system ATP-binding protein
MSYKETKRYYILITLTVGYGDKAILKDINFDVKDVVREGVNSTGQIIAFIARSGYGKSTLSKH